MRRKTSSENRELSLSKACCSYPTWFALLVTTLPLLSEAAINPTPDAGTILQQNTPESQPALPSLGSEFNFTQPDTGRVPFSQPFRVKRIELLGNTLIPSSVLMSLITYVEGQTLDLTQLNELAGRLTDYYHQHGYPLSRAVIPEQSVRDGVVTLLILEARYADVTLINNSQVRTVILQNGLKPLQTGQAIRQQDLDRSLLLMSDIPGVVIRATMKPGAAVGTSALQVRSEAAPAFTGNVALDNFGSQFTGRTRLGAGFNYNNPLHLGDVLSVNALNSGHGMTYGRLGYDILLNRFGTRAGVSYSDLNYVLGDSLAALHSNGTAQVQSLWLRHPLQRSADSNIYGQIQYDHLMMRDLINNDTLRSQRQLNNLTASLYGDNRDTWLGGGINNWSLGLTTGQVRLMDAATQLTDAATAKTQGTYAKWNTNLSRLQNISASNSLLLKLTAQWAMGNLDSSQKISLGGPLGLRAYDTGSIVGDNAVLISSELRHSLGAVYQGQLSASAFVDAAHVMVNASPWAAGSNQVQLYGAGLGMSWVSRDHLSINASVAIPLGPEQANLSHSPRAWITLTKNF